ncbi:prolyl oligopeptidase family serine peptidase [Ornithinibacillus halophilus]|uniref:prolyl oligopeptidase n=1 Tax=Ornithinibacillus halophilus TaxID=930117 RepID=A0A1M5KYS0_9BACI|nr:prolyl oligopeptidase family serine peptidase [Ornithinibacillus halophilus]SHG57303.1 prolyl oligopeptidase Serine peptidase. MEROPS family S09A [Ornithinibacillus halophilus]
MTTYKDNIVEDFHGTKVADPYRWLEDPDSDRSQDWSKQAMEQCDTYFSDATTREVDRKRLEELWNYPKYFVPKKVKDILFYQKNDGLQNQAILYKKINDTDEVLIDPNTLSDDGTVAMTGFSISNDAKYIAYATSTHGSDWQEIRIRDIHTGEDLEDVIKHVKFTNTAWAPDNSGFYYARFPEPGSVSKEDESNYNRVYFHKIGHSQSEDTLIHEQPEDKELMFSPLISADEKYLLLYVMLGTATENRFYIKKLNGEENLVKLLDDQDAEYEYITNENNIFYFKTNLDAPNGKVIAIDTDNPTRENWTDIISEQEDVIDHVEYMDGKFIVALLHDAHHQIHIFNKSGEYSQSVELPVLGSLTNVTKSKEDHELYFGITSFLNPTTVYTYNLQKEKLTITFESELPIDTGEFETNQVFYTSKDGTKVPMFLTHKKGLELDGQNPVILYGYGGFNISMSPTFNPAILRWLEKGGVYAVANLRGGTEYGEEWHRAGMLENKQNVFDDFISAGEWLIESRYTDKGKLSIMGGSNGGLLVAACMVQRPDLFGAVICRVPVIDMLRYHKFTIGRYWIPEYGSADNPEQFPFLYSYSPLHNIKEGEKYPPTLIATAESDDRVVPAHSKKFAATLWEKADPNSTVILRLESKAGHGLGKPTSKVIDEWVDFYAFLDKELN